MDKKNIVIVGPAASGKDTLRKRLESKGFRYCKLCTTRPKRDGETNSDYLFLSESEFIDMDRSGRFKVKNEYNNWKYGIDSDEFFKSGLFVLTPEYIKELGEAFINNSFIVYLNPPESIRRERLSERNDADSVDRRVDADTKQFENFTTFDIEITNPYF